eukprot:5650954-Lingulodinium_polyedra.AAC.1
MVETLDVGEVQLKEKVELLGPALKAPRIISTWAGFKDARAKYVLFAENAEWPQAGGQAVKDVYAVM